MVQEAAEKHH